MGALRAGAGLVTIVGPESCREELSRIPECMTVGLPDRDGIVSGVGLDVLDEMQHDVIAVGPGLGVGSGPKALVEKIFGFTNVPLVLDADALTIAFINKRAISAGALIALACDKIVMVKGGEIGAVTPVSGGGDKAGISGNQANMHTWKNISTGI